MPNESNFTAKSHYIESFANNGETLEKESDNSEHPIRAVIDKALHRVRDVESVTRFSLFSTWCFLKLGYKTIVDELENFCGKFDANNEDSELQVDVCQQITETTTLLERLSKSNFQETLLTSLFLRLFTIFDAFLGDLLVSIYEKNQDLPLSKDAQIPLKDIVEFESLEELKRSVLFDYIETLRRKSYVEQFETLENRFGISLRKFDSWPTFVEMSQRQNIITNCDGKVSRQYITQCQMGGYEFDNKIIEDMVLKIEYNYLTSTSLVLYEIILKLGQTLWRKIFPNESDIANEHLNKTTYEALKFEQWDRAVQVTNFYLETANIIQDAHRKMRIINGAIAFKFSGQNEQAQNLLALEDWSASATVFKIAVSVLKDEFKQAAELMKQAGKKSDFHSQQDYHDSPLFKEFRKTQYFLEAYYEIYKTSFLKEEKKQSDDKGKSSSDAELDALGDFINMDISISDMRKFVG